MRHCDFLSQVDHDAVVAAIGDAEKGTSGQVRLFLSHKKTDDAVAAARAQFERLGMAQTRHRNAILIFVAPRSRAFAVVGDSGIHAKEDGEWAAIAAALGERFRASDFTGGLRAGIARAGEFLRAHFPADGPRENELPDEIEGD